MCDTDRWYHTNRGEWKSAKVKVRRKKGFNLCREKRRRGNSDEGTKEDERKSWKGEEYGK